MELLHLLISFLSTAFISLILSLLLPFRYLLRRVSNPRVTADPVNVILYRCPVWHERRCPVHHSFLYPVRYALFDLDGASHAPTNHLFADEARYVANTKGRVFLLTIPPSVGYEQHPLSLYYCYDFEASKKTLRKCIAEVTNTPWGERVSFLFNLSSDLVAKCLHVSLIQHPRNQNPAYKEEALLRDETIRCCQAHGGNQTSNVREPGPTFDQLSITENIRCCT